MKRIRIMTWVMVIAMLVTVCGYSGMGRQAKAAELQEGIWKYDVLDDGTVEITGCSEAEGALEIPETLYGKKVTSIDTGVFSGSGLKSITIPSSVTSISSLVFKGCSSLESIIVDEDNEIYDSRNNCNAIIEKETNTLITGCMNTIIPDSVTCIGKLAFAGCSNLTDITIPDSVTEICYSAFYDCSSLTTINIPYSVTSIGNTICNNLAIITVDPNNEVYDSRNNCNAIIEKETNTLITGCINTIIPDSVTSIGSYAFYDCSSLANINIPDSVTKIGDSAFNGCSSLTGINIPDSVTSIDNYVFQKCSSLTYIIIPDSVTSIELGTFLDCSSLTGIKIPDSVTSIADNAFSGCNQLTITTPKNSYADSYARINNIPLMYTDGSNVSPDPVPTDNPSGTASSANTPALVTAAESPSVASPADIPGKDITIPTISKMAGVKATGGKKMLTLKWTKIHDISGYQVQVSLKKNFKGAKTANIKKTAVKYTVKKLKSRKTYYIRIRAYSTYDDANGDARKAYGKWVTVRAKVK